MGIVSRFLESRIHPGSGDPVLIEMFGGRRTRTGQVVTADTALNISACYRAVRLLADTMASLPIHLYKRLERGKERDVRHPLYHLLHTRPNPWQTSFEWREMMSGHLELRGNAYSFIVTNGRGGVDALIPLHPGRVTCHKDKVFHDRPPVIWYEWTPLDGSPKVLLQDEVLHLRGFSLDGITGLSPVTQARESLGLAMAVEEHGAKYFGNAARPGGFLKLQKKLASKDARDKLLESLNTRFGGDNQHKVGVLEEGADWVSVGFDNRDSEFLASRKFQVTEIARWWGVPPHKIGDLDRSTNNNIEHQGIEFVQDAILPRCRRFEQRLNSDMLSGSDQRTKYFEFLLDGLLRGDLKSRYEAYQIGRNGGWLSANDIRESENMNPLDDEQGDVYLVPLNMVSAGDDTDDEGDEDDLPPAPEKKSFMQLRALLAESYRGMFVDAAQRCVRAEAMAARRTLERARTKNDVGVFDTWLVRSLDETRDITTKRFEPVSVAYARAVHGICELELGQSPIANVTEALAPLVRDFVAGAAQRSLEDSVNRTKAVSRAGAAADVITALDRVFADDTIDALAGEMAERESTRLAHLVTAYAYRMAGRPAPLPEAA